LRLRAQLPCKRDWAPACIAACAAPSSATVLWTAAFNDRRLLAEENRLRALYRLTRTRLRRHVLHAAVCIGVSVSVFSRDGLCALALLRSRCADRRTIERCRAVAASECGSSDRGRNSNQQGGDELGLHGVTPITFRFHFRKASQGPVGCVCNVDGRQCIPLLSKICSDNLKLLFSELK
jgi:hypothetical protein